MFVDCFNSMPHPNREFHGFGNPLGLQVEYTRVWFRVAIFVPSQNPYPRLAGMGFGGFFHGFSKYRWLAKCNLMHKILCFTNVFQRLLAPTTSEGTYIFKKKLYKFMSSIIY
jgi:hypothetical protein